MFGKSWPPESERKPEARYLPTLLPMHLLPGVQREWGSLRTAMSPPKPTSGPLGRHPGNAWSQGEKEGDGWRLAKPPSTSQAREKASGMRPPQTPYLVRAGLHNQRFSEIKRVI